MLAPIPTPIPDAKAPTFRQSRAQYHADRLTDLLERMQIAAEDAYSIFILFIY
jgi:hypothetical protein